MAYSIDIMSGNTTQDAAIVALQRMEAAGDNATDHYIPGTYGTFTFPEGLEWHELTELVIEICDQGDGQAWGEDGPSASLGSLQTETYFMIGSGIVADNIMRFDINLDDASPL